MFGKEEKQEQGSGVREAEEIKWTADESGLKGGKHHKRKKRYFS